MNAGQQAKELASLVEDMDVDRFSLVVDAFIDAVQQAELTER